MSEDAKLNDYVTFRELVEREEKLRKELRGEMIDRTETLGREMTSRFTNFGHEVAKQFVEERETLRKERPHPDEVSEVQSLRHQLTELASGKHGIGMKLVGVGLILLSVAVILHSPMLKGFTPFG